jgi:hypothetical protein
MGASWDKVDNGVRRVAVNGGSVKR